MLSILRTYWWIPVAVAGWGFWLHAHDAAITERAKAQAAVDKLVERSASLDSLVNQVNVRDSVIKIQRTRVESDNRAAAQKAAVTQARLDSTVKEFAATLDSAQKVRFDEIETEHKSIVALKDQEIAGLKRIVAMQDSLAEERKQVQDGLKRLNDQFAEQAQDIVNKMKPSTLDKIGKVAGTATLILSGIGAFK